MLGQLFLQLTGRMLLESPLKASCWLLIWVTTPGGMEHVMQCNATTSCLQVDEDNSGEIEFSEFCKVISKHKAATAKNGDEGDTLDAFVALGGNCDKTGKISTDKLRATIKVRVAGMQAQRPWHLPFWGARRHAIGLDSSSGLLGLLQACELLCCCGIPTGPALGTT
jgi:hypothetical protein